MEYKGLILSDFQVDAIDAIVKNENVIVSTHTGNGKTLIADYAVDLCRREGKEIVYTAPIKALSNQKYKQFVKEFGAENVGLITGDRVINDTAPILIMTTEILRNMLHEDPYKIENIKYIVFDEIHYLNDEERGTVWEESIIFKNKETRLIGLSATIPNIQELCDWIEYIHSEKVARVFYPDRIIPQKHFYFDKKLGPCKKRDILINYRKAEDLSKLHTTHIDFIKYAAKEDILPVLFFVFSRRQCEEKAFELAQNFDLLKPSEKNAAREILLKKEQEYPVLQNMQSWENVKTVASAGICFHHAGLLPIIKEVIEELFEHKLAKILYATETFAVGINYPVRTVCFDTLRKFDGTNFRNLTGSEYLQMAGRAGRRGIDKFGYVFSLVDYKYFRENELLDLDRVSSDRVESQFRLTYNTVLNLASRYTREQVDEIFKKSLANYQYINSLNNKYNELNELKKQLQSANANSSNKNTCKYFNSSTCPLVQTNLRDELRNLINASKQKNLSREEALSIKKEIGEIQLKLKSANFKKCSKGQLRQCSVSFSDINRLKTTIKKIEKTLVKLSKTSPDRKFSTEFDEKLVLLEQLGYIKDNGLLARGQTCARIHVQELFVTELIFEGLFYELDENMLNALMSAIVFEDDRILRTSFKHSFDFSKVYAISESIKKKEAKLGLEPSTTFIDTPCPIVYEWSNGCSFEDISLNSDLLEGDFVALIRRILDLYRQIKNAYSDDKRIVDKINNCIHRINRDVVELGL